MAHVEIRRRWAEGDVLAVAISVETSFPDAVSEARHAAVRAFEDALEVSMAYDEQTADDDERAGE